MSEQRLQLLDTLKQLHGSRINPLLIDCSFVQNEEECLLSLRFKNMPFEETIIHICAEADNAAILLRTTPDKTPIYLNHKDDIVDNARRFLELDAYWLCYLCEEIYTNTERSIIIAMHHQHE